MPRAASGCPPEHRPLSSDAVWRLRGRSNFTRLRTEGRRVRRGPITVIFASPSTPGTPPRVGYAIARHVGNAVERNRLRRRLREVVHQSAPPSGDYLISASAPATQLTFSQLRGVVHDALLAAEER